MPLLKWTQAAQVTAPWFWLHRRQPGAFAMDSRWHRWLSAQHLSHLDGVTLRQIKARPETLCHRVVIHSRTEDRDMPSLTPTYDASQHCTATASSKGKSVAVDCPYTGKGEELSPGDLPEAALAGCMLTSMGAVAKRDDIDLTGTAVDVELVGTPPPKIGYQAINAAVRMRAGIEMANRLKLKRAANACPIKHSFDPRIKVSRSSLNRRIDPLPFSPGASYAIQPS